MSAPRPGRRAAPKSRFSAFRAGRKSSAGGGRRADGKSGGPDSTTDLPAVTAPLREPAQTDPLARPLLDTDPFGILANRYGGSKLLGNWQGNRFVKQLVIFKRICKFRHRLMQMPRHLHHQSRTLLDQISPPNSRKMNSLRKEPLIEIA